MKRLVRTLSVLCCMLTVVSIVYAMHSREAIAEQQTLQFFKKEVVAFQLSLHQLDTAIAGLRSKDTTTVVSARKALAKARIRYKSIEFFTEYFFDHTANIYNRPPVYEIEVAGHEYEDPIGLQVVEDILANPEPYAEKEHLTQQLVALTSSADDLPSLLYNLNITDAQILESVRLELLRISTLGITGYDAPYLKTGIVESEVALASLTEILQPYLKTTTPLIADSVAHSLQLAAKLLQHNPDFNSFDRLGFYTNGLAPLQHHLTQMIQQLRLDVNTTGVINYNATSIFSPDFFEKSNFLPSRALPGKDEVELGKKLFFDKGLSANKMRSCATCHQPDKFFTDGLKTNISLSGTTIKRNSPSLLYAVYQYAQFLDGKESNLKDQAEKVITNASEMNGNPHNIMQLIRRSPTYLQLFQQAFPNEKEALQFETIASAIAAYETSLAPFNSAFDQYMAGKKQALSKQQQAGFNLFAGKAKCATCHFLPLFNGLTPPDYQRTEFEILGVPATSNFAKPRLDKDSGRYYNVPLPYTIGSFKTPTIRNTAATAPYMHNGSLPTLEKVMDFYNEGGGQGIGIKMAYQTLSPQKLGLTKKEIKEVVLFINSLTDKPVKYN